MNVKLVNFTQFHSAVSELPSEIKPVDASADASMSSEGHSIYKYTPGQGTKKVTLNLHMCI